MLVALSRFRVLNGMEVPVIQAFVDRPCLVDSVIGFLGMEVFTDSRDEKAFYLLTRWSDGTCFERWHDSAEHRRSHSGMPRGLTLDPEFTSVIKVQRIASSTADGRVCDAIDSARLLSTFLDESRAVLCWEVAKDGIILRGTGTAGVFRDEAPVGKSLWPMLANNDAEVLRQRINDERVNQADRFRLNFVGEGQSLYTLDCQLETRPDSFVLIGERAGTNELSLQNELLVLNNHLATLSRENARQYKELEIAKAALEKALNDLNSSHWHLRKLHEVLPICLDCERVRPGEKTWQDVVQYLREHAAFLSHGYCPECMAKAREKMGLPQKET